MSGLYLGAGAPARPVGGDVDAALPAKNSEHRTGGPVAGAILSSPPQPRILAVGRAFPPNYADQETLTAALTAHWSRQHFNSGRLAQIHKSALVDGRHLALPIAEYARHDTFGKKNDAFIRVGLDVGEAAIRDGMARAGLTPADVDHLVFVSVTGIATPSLDARLVNRLSLKSLGEADAHLRPRLPGWRRRPGAGLRRAARLPGRGGRPPLRGALLAHAPAGGPLHPQRGGHRPLRRRRRGGGAGGRRAAGAARPPRASWPPARSSTRAPSGSWAGTWSTPASRWSSRPRCRR